MEWRAAEAEEQLVKWVEEGDKRGGDEVVGERAVVIWI